MRLKHLVLIRKKNSYIFNLFSNSKRVSAARKFSRNFGQNALKFLNFRQVFSKISGHFGLFLLQFFPFLPYPTVFIAFLCDNFSKILKKSKIFCQHFSKVFYMLIFTNWGKNRSKITNYFSISECRKLKKN